MSETAEPGARGRDRTARLVLFGAVAAAGGAGLGLLALLYLGLAVLAAAGRAPAGVHVVSALTGAVLWAGLGVAFAATGIGSIRRRRWAPRVMPVLAWTWLLGGLVVLPLVPATIGAAVAGAGATDPAVARIATLVVTALVAAGGVALPALFVWVYRDPAARRTCEAHDPTPSRVERVPEPVLGLGLALGAAAVLAVPLAARPVVPVFGRFVGGPLGVVAVLGGAVACAWLARASFRLRPAAWWGTTGLMVVAGVSTAVTLHRAEPGALYDALGYGAAERALLPAHLERPLAWISWALTAASVVYMLALRRHFARGAGADPDAGEGASEGSAARDQT